jgi:hypothetical protein
MSLFRGESLQKHSEQIVDITDRVISESKLRSQKIDPTLKF